MANEKRLIDANALKWKIGQVRLYVASLRFGKTIISKILESYRKAVFYEIEDAPTVDAVEVVHGQWLKAKDGFDIDRGWKCSSCNNYVYAMTYEPYEYCPHCGAKMDGGNEDA